MDAKTMLLVAFGVALVLPYVTIALLRGGGRFGVFAVAGLFVGVVFLVVYSDFQNDGESRDGDA